jgi:hypothetical protein
MQKTLNQDEISYAQSRIDRLPAGFYEVSQIYGDSWDSITSPTTFGRKFKATVISGYLLRIAARERKSNNHSPYEIFR